METNLGPEYCITVTVPNGTIYGTLCQYWEGQWDPLYAVLSRTADMGPVAVPQRASADEVTRLREASVEALVQAQDHHWLHIEWISFIDALDEAVDASARAEVEGELYGAGIIEDPDA